MRSVKAKSEPRGGGTCIKMGIGCHLPIKSSKNKKKEMPKVKNNTDDNNTEEKTMTWSQFYLSMRRGASERVGNVIGRRGGGNAAGTSS
jgi:hypothetical protein